MPSTATIEAIPIAMPSAESAARSRRVRSPSAPVRRTSAGADPARARARSCGHAPAARRVSDSTRPSRSAIRRGSEAAMPSSCVITTIVAPSACSSRSSAMIPSPARESRLPVGSSANTIAGRPTQRPRDRDPLALAARELRRHVPEPVPEPDALERLARPRPPLGRAGARVEQPGGDVVERRSSRRAGRTAGRRSRSGARAAPPARARPARRRPARRPARRRSSPARACP